MPRQRAFSAQTESVLGALLDDPKAWQYGYDLSRRTRLKAGTLYPMLMRLCDQGLLRSTWRQAEEPGRPPRHVYRLTAQGLAAARSLSREPATRRSSLRPAKVTL
jgi:PadR family transcriptional regulator PadR